MFGKDAALFHVFIVVQTVRNCAKHLYLTCFCVEYKWFEEEMGYVPP